MLNAAVILYGFMVFLKASALALSSVLQNGSALYSFGRSFRYCCQIFNHYGQIQGDLLEYRLRKL